jgi:hypothetical protein
MSKRVKIGFFSDGGIGSHPGIISAGAFSLMGRGVIAGLPKFRITSEEKEIPESLVCVYDQVAGWDIHGISASLGQKIMELIESDNITSEDPDGFDVLKEVCWLLDYPAPSKDMFMNVTIIPNPSLDTIYWSDETRAQSWWSPPYEAKSVWELLDLEELSVSGVSLSRLLPKMREDGII